VYENRLVKSYLHQVQERLQRVERVLEEGRSLRSYAEQQTEARMLREQLQQARRQAVFLEEVALPVHLPTRVTMVLLNRPLYRAALEGYLELHRSARVLLDEPSLEAPLENLPYLYQVWGTLEVIGVLLATAAELGYEVMEQRLVTRSRGEAYVRVLRDGQAAVVLRHPSHGTTVRLTPKPTYGRLGALRSISYQQEPDVVVEVEELSGEVRVYLFDPKYKLQGELVESQTTSGAADVPAGGGGDGRPKKIDIDTMHAYRDAIRNAAQERVVKYAAILYPGPGVRYGDGIEALRAYPGAEQELESRVRAVLSGALDAPDRARAGATS
jgi:predicted component of viral defense system (DUF524 family)